jgi:hypothetical protein
LRARAGATHLLLVNSDVTVPPDAVHGFSKRWLRSRRRNCQSTMVVRTRRDRIDSAGLSFDAASGRMRMLRADGGIASAPGDAVDAVSGALLARRVFERIGAGRALLLRFGSRHLPARPRLDRRLPAGVSAGSRWRAERLRRAQPPASGRLRARRYSAGVRQLGVC